MSKKDPDQKVPVGRIATLLMITDTRVQQLTQQGVIVKSGRGTYLLDASIQGYIKYMQRVARNGNGLPPGNEEASDGVNESSYGKHRARLYKARADKAEIEAELMKGTTHAAEAVAAVWSDMIGNARAKLLALPTKLAGALDGLEITEREALIKDGVAEALRELANYSPQAITGEWEKRRQPMEDEDEDEDEPDE